MPCWQVLVLFRNFTSSWLLQSCWGDESNYFWKDYIIRTKTWYNIDSPFSHRIVCFTHSHRNRCHSDSHCTRSLVPGKYFLGLSHQFWIYTKKHLCPNQWNLPRIFQILFSPCCPQKMFTRFQLTTNVTSWGNDRKYRAFSRTILIVLP